MKLKRALNEVTAEIVNGSIPSNKIFSVNGNIVSPKEEENWNKVLGEVLAAIEKAGLSADFKRDMDPLDIQTGTAGKIKLQSDSGKRYTYDINKKKLFKA